MGSRLEANRVQRVRARWWEIIGVLEPDEARAALLQVLADIDEHWAKEHEDDGLPEDLGIPPEEYLTEVLRRIRNTPPAEARGSD